MLCTQDFWKSKEKPFLWLTQLKSSCHSNMGSQLSCFCFILNKLFLLRKMFFCLEVNWRQTLTPLFAAEGVLAAAQILYVLSKKQGDHQFHFDYHGVSILKDHSVTVTPPLFAVKGILCFSVLNTMRVLFAGMQEAGTSTLSLTTVHESGALLVWRAGVPEI